ncbi:autotransporter-associated beta strand repeat-containing protein, partial [Candidatus Spyradosoma sp. SGI.093]|uniref:beta strand repeat-containing protein n=1 Tax=Candidatus Spyradosoma sp. SGI.093 TaxID=3420583 RepID=UPI003D00C1BC
MRNSKFLLTSLLAAATMSVPAFADDVALTNGEQTALTIGSGVAGAGNTYTYTAPEEGTTDNGGWLWLGTLGATGNVALGSAESSMALSGSGLIVLGYQGGDGSTPTYTFDFANTDASAFFGKFAVVNEWNNSTVAKLSGTGWSNVEYVFAGVSREQNWVTKRMYGNTSRGYDTLSLQGATTLAGITGTSKGYSPVAEGEVVAAGIGNINLRESITVATSGTVLTLAGAGTYEFYGKVGTASEKVGIEKTGTGTQVLGGTLYLDGVTVSGGTLDFSGATLSLSSEITNNATVTVSSDTIFVLSDSLKVGDTGNTYSLISGGTINGWNAETLSAENFQISGVVTSLRGASVDVSTVGQVVFTAGAAGNIVWAGTSGNSTWNSSAENWTHNSAPTKFYALDNVTFGADAENKTVTLENGTNLAVGDMTVTGGSYRFQPTTDSASASISGNTLRIESNATLTSKTVNLLFDDIVLAGRLSLDADKFSASALTWGKLTFEGGTLHIEDTQNSSGFLSIREVAMNGAGTITSRWSRGSGTKFTIGTLSGTGNLSITGGTSEPISYSIGTLSGYLGTLSMQKGADTVGLTVEITGTASGNGANASFVVGSGVTLWVEGSSARFDWNKITLSDGATLKLRNGYGTSNNGHDGSEILIDAAGGSATIAGSLYGNGTNILGKIHGTGTLNVTSAETEWCNDLKISALLADGANDGDRLALNVNMGTGTVDSHVGTLTLTGENTYSGGTTIAAGNLVAAHQSALGTGALEVQSGATLKLGVAAVSAYGLSGAGAVSLASGTSSSTLTVNGGGDFSGTITGAIALVKSGSETLTLSGANTYSGGTTIEGGVLKVDSLGWGDKGNLGETFAQDKTVLKNGGVLEVTEAQNANMTSGYRDGGAMRGFSVANGEGTYRYSGEGTSYIAPNVNSSSEFQANSHIGIAAGAVLIFDVTNSTATLDVSKVIASNAKQETVSNELVATTGALKKTGAGTVILSGDNKYTGGTVIEAGTV